MLASWSARGGLVLLTLLASGEGRSAPAVLFESAPGQVQVVATDVVAARPVLSAAESAWCALAGPLELPERFASPITIRVVPCADWRDSESTRLVVEPPGAVTVWLRGDATVSREAQQALVRALLVRKAVAATGANGQITVPRWLEEGATSWWRAAESGSEIDWLKQDAERLNAPTLSALLSWRRGATTSPELTVGAYWLIVFLQSESGPGRAWSRMLATLLAGGDSADAIQRQFGIALASEGEIWWRTGWHHYRRIPVLPGLSAAESRAMLADAIRQVWLKAGVETVVPPDDWPELAGTAAGRTTLNQAAQRISRCTAMLHPFYRNAALSLVAALNAAGSTTSEAFAATRAHFEADWQEATALEAASATALDALATQQARGARVLAAPR